MASYLLDLDFDLSQSGRDHLGFVIRQNALFGQHRGMRDRTTNIMTIQTTIEADAFSELLDSLVRGCIKDAATRRAFHDN